ncbi:MAG: hypothetical protein WCG27_02070, partial [Pseudomonadota bacterium]
YCPSPAQMATKARGLPLTTFEMGQALDKFREEDVTAHQKFTEWMWTHNSKGAELMTKDGAPPANPKFHGYFSPPARPIAPWRLKQCNLP